MPVNLDKSQLPTPIFDENPALVDFYWFAWETAWKRIKETPGAPQPFYMDEGLDEPEFDNAVWIWDTCFMALFCKYAPGIFPGIESLNNFYVPMHDDAACILKVWHPDNPPLFAWVEYMYFQYTGNRQRLDTIFKKGYLQKHFSFFEGLKRDMRLPFAHVPVALEREGPGYYWSGWASGMDNSPRGHSQGDGNFTPMYWVDAIAQQALAALYISKIAETVGDGETAKAFKSKHAEFSDLINRYYWDAADGTYYDLNPGTLEKIKVPTPASFWPMLAEVCSSEQAAALAEKLSNPNQLGGLVPWPTVSRSDPAFEPKGNYWRGGVWLPTAYMGTKALEKYGYDSLADQTAERLLLYMLQTYQEYTPHTIWECYSPEKPVPATDKDNITPVRPDFCGWSALGPISLLIENVLGFYEINAQKREVFWRKHQVGRHGISNLRCGEIQLSIIADGNEIRVETTHPFTLVVNQHRFEITQSRQTLMMLA